MVIFEKNWKRVKKKAILSKDRTRLWNFSKMEWIIKDIYAYVDKNGKKNIEENLYVKFLSGDNCKVFKSDDKWTLFVGFAWLKDVPYHSDDELNFATVIGHEFSHYFYEDSLYKGKTLTRISMEMSLFSEVRADLYGKKVSRAILGSYRFDWVKGSESLKTGYPPLSLRLHLAKNYDDYNLKLVLYILSFLKRNGNPLQTFDYLLNYCEKMKKENKLKYNWLDELLFLDDLKKYKGLI